MGWTLAPVLLKTRLDGSGWATGVAFSPDGEIVASAGALRGYCETLAASASQNRKLWISISYWCAGATGCVTS
ncbi:MAG: hypothetical protein KME26_01065 [Oscillatoria princeps RMCB-10]|nr:hypothetical protein [Oscillatoria princeps RMCB-10]